MVKHKGNLQFACTKTVVIFFKLYFFKLYFFKFYQQIFNFVQISHNFCIIFCQTNEPAQ